MKKFSLANVVIVVSSVTLCAQTLAHWFGIQSTPLLLVSNWAMILFLTTLLVDVLLRMGKDGWWREHAVPILLTAIVGIAIIVDFASKLRLM